MRRFFVEPRAVQAGDVRIIGDEARHIRNVLRMAAGDRVILFDGTGEEIHAQITAITGEAVELRVFDRRKARQEPTLDLAVAQGLLKDRKMDDLIRPLTELGMTRWIPFQADRSVPRQDEKKRCQRAARWEKIARESLKQCGRSRPPQVAPVVCFADMLAASEGYGVKLFFWENALDGMTQAAPAADGALASVFIVLGPEGGFNEHEAARARAAGFALVSLGPRILRAETAAVTAAALAQFCYGDMAAGRPKTP